MTWLRTSWLLGGLAFSAFAGACSSDGAPPGGGSGDGDGGGAPGLGGGSGDGDGDGDGGGDGTGGKVGTGGGPMFTCEEVTCLDTQSCEIVDGTARCLCLPGFGGPLCEQESLCAATPDLCGDGAECIDSAAGYWCECQPGYEYDGAQCDDVDECAKNPCAAGATCTDEEGEFSCSCPSGEFGNGLFCKSTDDCAGNPCGPNGSCVNTPSGYACECEEGYEGQTSCTACSEIAVQDALATVIRNRLGIGAGAPITPADVSDLTSLNATNAGITSLDGLECWAGLRTLDVANNSIDDAGLAAASKLTQLEELNLSCNQVESLDALEEHPHLRVLRANASTPACGKLTDISAVGTLSELEVLSLDSHDLTEISEVGGLSRLSELSLNYNDLAALPPLSGLPRLTELYMAGNASLADISPLSSASALVSLDLTSTQANVLGALSSQTQLTTLRVSQTGLSDLAPLSGLTQLRVLSAQQNIISNLSPLSGLSLQRLDLFQNSVQDIEPLTAGNLSGEVYLVNNPLSCDTQQVHLDTLKDQGVVVYGTCQ